MKTGALLDKYRKIIAGLINCSPDDIKFFVKNSSGKLEEIEIIEYFEPEKDKEGNETGNKIRYTRWNDWSEGSYSVVADKQTIASFELYKLPHCCAILVSCKAWVSEKYRGKRVGTTLNNLRQEIGRVLGYSTLMCTDIEQNKHQRQLLATNGWKDIYSVKNKRTENKVFVSVINL